jgi:hypothetical protein
MYDHPQLQIPAEYRASEMHLSVIAHYLWAHSGTYFQAEATSFFTFTTFIHAIITHHFFHA